VGRKLVEANVRKNPALVAQCLTVFTPLRDAWREGCLGRAPVPVA
jgi:flagellin-specific chaperone FliS